MLIRKATLNDIDELIELRIEFMSQLNKNVQVTKEFIVELQAYFEEHLRDDSFVAWVAVDNDEIIAASAVCFYTVPPSFKNITGKNAYIMNVYTREDYRRRGIGAKLFEKTIEEARIHGCRKIHLSATKDGAPLYEKFNFKYNSAEMEYYLV